MLNPRRLRAGNRVTRLVSVVMSDSNHGLHLIEVEAIVRQPGVDTPYRADRAAVEAAARKLLEENGHGNIYLDFVGILIASTDPLHRGHIAWAEEIAPVEAVTV